MSIGLIQAFPEISLVAAHTNIKFHIIKIGVLVSIILTYRYENAPHLQSLLRLD